MAFVGGLGGVAGRRRRRMEGSCPRAHEVECCAQENPRLGERRELMSRREVIRNAFATTLGWWVWGPVQVGMAAEEDPSSRLPPGALQFDRVIKAQKNWEEIRNVVASKKTDLSVEEWAGVRSFLRKYYSIGDDMQYLARNLSTENRKAIDESAKSFRKTVKGMDKVAEKNDVDQFLDMHKQANDIVNQFFVLLRSDSSIPDEL